MPDEAGADDAGADDAAQGDGKPNECKGASTRVHVALEVHGPNEPLSPGFGSDRFDDYIPVVTVHVSQVPASPEGKFIVVSSAYDKHEYKRGYTRGTEVQVGDLQRLLETKRNDLVEGANDGGPLVVGATKGALSISDTGRVTMGGRTVGWAKIENFGSPLTDAGSPLARSSLDAAAVAEELITIASDGGGLEGERWRTLLFVPDIEPIDACRTEVGHGQATFSCERGAHPTARVRLEDGTLVTAVTSNGSERTVERLPLPPGACVTFEGSYRQVGPFEPRYSELLLERGSSRFDPFLGIAEDRAVAPYVQAPTRCSDAGAGAPLDVHLIVPRHSSAEGASLFIPALGLRKKLGIGVSKVTYECEARVYSRSEIAVVRCYRYDNETEQKSVFIDNSELLTGSRSPFHPNDGSVLLPCNSKVRFVVRYQ